ncbi:MAG: caspase family protein, partial [Ferruginibacter sp.]|nr:caspase family protein [Chitinophagaceae bacterium]
SNTNNVKLLDTGTPGLVKVINGFTKNAYRTEFSRDGKRIFTASADSSAKIWDTETGELVADLNLRIGNIFSVNFSPDNKKILTTSYDGTAKIWNAETGELHYTFLAVDSSDYLVTGKHNQYDGSPAARKLIYFVCNDEVIWLDQVKDQLWVPNLAERINKGETINAKRLEDLELCGLTPATEEGDSKPGEYSFRVTPRRGGLGMIILYVNGIEARSYTPGQLFKNTGVYTLTVKKQEIQKYFIPGRENPVTVKAYTADNTISSRVVRITADEPNGVAATPNLYAVMVGISDYKGDELDLKYAAKDAIDISNAVKVAAKKLLNTDGKEHVFIYNLTTTANHYQLPEKNSIKKLLGEIGTKATANDILLIFFAGHGKMEGAKKQFYFLTADASPSAAALAIADVGISTTELTEWIKPAIVKAQKRVLIFDACNSGQAIRDFVKIGTTDQNYMSARGDEQGQQAKAIDKLNEQSGFFILSASASDQKAYELGRYSQGLLTYSLLKVLKQQPDILENGKYLDISRWFNAAGRTVSELSKENGARQQPQLITNTNFNIGVVDEEVIGNIVLAAEKPLFASSIFLNNDEAIGDDDLEISKMINSQLANFSSRGTDSKIVYITASNSPDAYQLSGRYDVTGNTLLLKVNIKQGREIKYRFEVTGRKDNLKGLAEIVVQQATEWIMKNK